MFHRFSLFTALSLALLLAVLPTQFAAARTITFDQGPTPWRVTVKVCTNGFTVTATGGTPADAMTAVKVVSANLLLPNDKPPFIRLTRPLPFTSATGSMLVAMAGNPKVQVTGTANFYFQDGISIGSVVQTVIEAYSNGVPLNIATGTGTDSATNCQVPPPPAFVNDLSGVIIDLYAAQKNPLAADGRASPNPGDPMVVYCISSGQFAGTIVVNGIDPSGNPPYRLAQFSYNAVVSARGKGISVPAMDNRGELSVSMPKYGIFLAEWTNGGLGTYMSKLFTCWMDKSKYNKTADQLKYPDAFGADGRVAPNPADKVAVYCNIGGGSIKIVGVNRQSQGYDLATFKYTEVLAAAPNPIVKQIPDQGTVSLQVDFDDDFFLKWSGGPWGEDQNKGFKCRF